MGRYNRNRNSSSRSYYSYDKPINQIPDLPYPRQTPTSNLYPQDEVDGHGNARTAFQKLRSYDIEVNKVDLKIAGAATIYGSKNNTQAFVWQSDKVGLYTADLNDKYANDDFRLLATIYRDASVNYWGIDYLAEVTDKTKMYRAVKTWINNTNNLVQQLEAAQNTDMAINTLSYQPEGKRLSKWSTILSPLQYLLTAYQTEIYLVLAFVQAFYTLRATLPKFQELYFQHAQHFTIIQNELSRARYTSKINSIMTWIKRRYVDRTFYKEIIAPLSVVSKKTDGLNSPIIYLMPVLNIPAEPLACANNGYSEPSFSGSDFSLIQRVFVDEPTRDSDNYINGVKQATEIGTGNKIISRIQNAWSLDTVLELILKGGSAEEVRSRLETWLDTAVATIDEVEAAILDFAQDRNVIALESMLARLSTAPGIGEMNWRQNLEVNVIPVVMKFADWEFTNELALLNISEPSPNTNGYELSVPMFRMAGIQKQIQLEYFQSFYLASNESYISYINVSNKVKMRFRDYTLVGMQLVRNKNNSTYEVRYMEQYDKTTKQVVKTGDWSQVITLDANYVSQAFQDKFTSVKFKTAGNSKEILWVNPQYMTSIKVQFTSRSAEFEVWNTQNYIIPLG